MFFIFGGSEFYPCGGAIDLDTVCSTHEDALRHIAQHGQDWDWWHIAELRNNTLVIVEDNHGVRS